MKKGTRKELLCDLMKPVFENFSSEEILNIAAYTESLVPQT